jgi:hypothetical protein
MMIAVLFILLIGQVFIFSIGVSQVLDPRRNAIVAGVFNIVVNLVFGTLTFYHLLKLL